MKININMMKMIMKMVKKTMMKMIMMMVKTMRMMMQMQVIMMMVMKMNIKMNMMTTMIEMNTKNNNHEYLITTRKSSLGCLDCQKHGPQLNDRLANAKWLLWRRCFLFKLDDATSSCIIQRKPGISTQLLQL